MVMDGETVGELQYETDRARFVGRARNLRDPVSVMDGRPLSNTVGPVLDPILSLRRTVRIPPGGTVHLIFSTIAAATREEVLDLADKYRDARTFERTLTLAWTQAQVQLHHLGITSEEAHAVPAPRKRRAVSWIRRCVPPPTCSARSSLDISTLWSQGISGDLPIVLARIDDPDDVDMIRQMLRAHEYWRMKQLSADVVIINEKAASYVQELQDSLEALVRGSQLRLSPDSGGASGKDISAARRSAHARGAHAIASRGARRAIEPPRHAGRADRALAISGTGWSAAWHARRAPRSLRTRACRSKLCNFSTVSAASRTAAANTSSSLNEGLRTPEPWVNVIANPIFRFPGFGVRLRLHLVGKQP